MLGTPAIKSLIRECKNHQIDSIVQVNKKIGMQTMDDCIYDLYSRERINAAEALEFAVDKIAMQKKVY